MHMDGPGLNSVQHSYISVLDSLNTGPGSDLICSNLSQRLLLNILSSTCLSTERQTTLSEGEMNELTE